MVARWLLAASLAGLLALTGCSDDETGAPPTPCPEGNLIGGVCAGVPAEPLCDTDVCVDGDCAETKVVDPSNYTQLVESATPGSCIALTPGSYGPITLPADVSAFGKGADHVTVGAVHVTGGSAVRVRGLTVSSGGLTIAAGATQVDAVRVSDSPLDGIVAMAGASATISRSEVMGAARYGVWGQDAAMDITSSIVSTKVQSGTAASPGVWLECSGGCACSGSLTGTLTNVLVRGNSLVGVSLVGVDAVLTDVAISETKVDAHFANGGGLSISGCSHVQATDLILTDHREFGLLVHDSTLDAEGVTASDCLRGIWLQNIGTSAAQHVTLRAVTVFDNDGAGIGVAGASTNVSIQDGDVRDTRMISLPVLIGGQSSSVEDVGDGITWSDGSHVTIDDVRLSGSARQSILIDGEVAAGSTIDRVELAAGDEALGILQQNLPQGGVQPTVGAAAPPITAVETEQFPVADGVAVPPGI